MLDFIRAISSTSCSVIDDLVFDKQGIRITLDVVTCSSLWSHQSISSTQLMTMISKSKLKLSVLHLYFLVHNPFVIGPTTSKIFSH